LAESDEGEKTEEPTGKRLEDARKKGNVARSAEIDTALFLVMLLVVIQFGGPYIIQLLRTTLIYAFENMDKGLTPLTAQNLYIRYSIYFWVILLPIGLMFLISGFVSMILQVGWLVTYKNLKLKFDIFKMDGLKEVFSVEGLKKLVVGVVKLIILTIITWMVVRKFLFDMLGLVNLDLISIFIFLVKLVVRIIISLIIFYAFFAIVDLIWTRFQHKKKLKMTKSEVKDEFKQMEGDPQVKRKIMTLMMEESMKRMMKEVPSADVVITNPIHLAIAIKYDPSVGDAPMVLAKGKRLIAEKIKEIAKENDIPIVEDKPLARLLYQSSDVGKPIDVQFFEAVAAILANVYKMKNRNF